MPEDDQAARGVEAQASQEEIAEAVKSLVGAGRDPVPGRVWAAIETARRRRQAEQEAAQRRAAASAAPPPDPEALQRGRAWIESIRRRRQSTCHQPEEIES